MALRLYNERGELVTSDLEIQTTLKEISRQFVVSQAIQEETRLLDESILEAIQDMTKR